MSFFDDICKAAKARDARAISLLQLKNCFNIDEPQDLALTPAGQFAQAGDWQTALWLVKQFKANLGNVLYGGILGGHIKSFQPNIEACPELQELCEHSSQSDHQLMAMGFAQMGIEDVFTTEIRQNKILMLCAIEGAAYGNQKTLLFQFDFSSARDYYHAVRGAACSGNEELTLETMRLSFKLNGSIEAIDECFSHAFSAAARGKQIQLISSLFDRSNFSYFQNLFTVALNSNNIHFLKMLKSAFPSEFHHRNSQLVHRAGQLSNYTYLEQCDHSDYAMFVSGMHSIIEYNPCFDFLIHFSSETPVVNFCKAVLQNATFSKDVREHIKVTRSKALEVIALKQSYQLETNQALLLHTRKELLPLLRNKEYESEALVKIMQQHTSMNALQIADIVKKVRKYTPRADLISQLEQYPKNTSGWWYNHLETCARTLSDVKNTPSHKGCNELVAQAYRLFHSPGVDGKQKTGKDAYYSALEAYCKTEYVIIY